MTHSSSNESPLDSSGPVWAVLAGRFFMESDRNGPDFRSFGKVLPVRSVRSWVIRAVWAALASVTAALCETAVITCTTSTRKSHPLPPNLVLSRGNRSDVRDEGGQVKPEHHLRDTSPTSLALVFLIRNSYNREWECIWPSRTPIEGLRLVGRWLRSGPPSLGSAPCAALHSKA
jgi:hypothetical protein